jgi:hypothetical protein
MRSLQTCEQTEIVVLKGKETEIVVPGKLSI